LKRFKNMIRLDPELLIGSGTVRACYHYPEKPELVVKVSLPGRAEGEAANTMEWKSYRRILRGNAEVDHISHCRGFVETDQGRGLVCDCIRDADGSVSETIWDIVVYRDNCDLDRLVSVADGFCSYLLANDLFLFDINLKNIALQVQPDGSCKPFAIDLKGPFDNKEFLRLSSRIRFLGRRKLQRRARQLRERIVLFRELREELKENDKRSPIR